MTLRISFTDESGHVINNLGLKEPHPINAAILLLGFNRFDLLEKRVDEIHLSGSEKQLYISIDGGPSNMNPSVIYQQLVKLTQDWKTPPIIRTRTKNLGLVTHITSQIDSILSVHDFVIVIEDDIRCSQNFFEMMLEGLQRAELNPDIMDVGGFSPLNLPTFKLIGNRWRLSTFFSAWGWAISKSNWQIYKELTKQPASLELLRKSISFQKMSRNQQIEWISRFAKVTGNPFFTWDYQMQYAHFVSNKFTLRPLSRIADNEGFDDSRSTNTKSNRPRWMGKIGVSKNPPRGDINNRLILSALTFLDSVTIGGYSRPARIARRLFKVWNDYGV